MKRYTIECDQFYNVNTGEDSEGEWVLYEDAEALIKEANKSKSGYKTGYEVGYERGCEDGKQIIRDNS